MGRLAPRIGGPQSSQWSRWPPRVQNRGIETFPQGPLIYQLWDLTGEPDGLYDFNGNLLDKSGNGNDITTFGTGSEYVHGSVPGTFALKQYDVNGLGPRATIPDFRYTGDMTLGMIIIPLQDPDATNTMYIIQQGLSSTGTGSRLWSVALAPDTGRIFTTWNSYSTTFTDITLSWWEPVVLHTVRDVTALTIKLFLNGYLSSTEAITAPTGGSASTLYLGGSNSLSEYACEFHQLKLFGRALTDLEVEDEARFVSRQAKAA